MRMPGSHRINVMAAIWLMLITFDASGNSTEEIPRGAPDVDRAKFTFTAEEQLLIHEVNRIRSDPQKYAQLTGLELELRDAVPMPPFAISEALMASSEFHSKEMAASNYFEHQSPVTGDKPIQLAVNSGYKSYSFFNESIAAGFDAAPQVLELLIRDKDVNPPGHRYHLLGMGPSAQCIDIGVGQAHSENSIYKHYWTIHGGRLRGAEPALTGVVYNDENRDGRFGKSEGVRDARIEVEGHPAWTVTNRFGGWTLRLPARHRYQLKMTSKKCEIKHSLELGQDNIELDFDVSDDSVEVNFGKP